MSRELLTELTAIKLHYNEKFLRMNPKTRKDFFHEFIIDFVFNTNSIEGNTITLRETANLLNNNLAPRNRTLREINDMKNSEHVFLNLLDRKEQLSNKLIVWIHDELLKNIDDRKGYRTFDIRVRGAGFKSTPFPYIKADIDLLLKWYKSSTLHPFVLACIFHHKFEKIHPFADGNGRTGRMIMNHILMNHK